MPHILYWFDTDFAFVESRVWLEQLLEIVADRLECEACAASSPKSLPGAMSWRDVFDLKPPTPESIFLMHGRTHGVEDALKALWEKVNEQKESLPLCRVVYSGGSEHASLATRFFDSGEVYCRIKSNPFNWSGEQLQLDAKAVGNRFADVVASYVLESKDPGLRLQDRLYYIREQVFEDALIIAAAIISDVDNPVVENARVKVLKTCYRITRPLNDLLTEWASDPPVHRQLEEINKAKNELFRKYDVPHSKVDADQLFRDVFRGTANEDSFYKQLLRFQSSLKQPRV